MGCVRGTGWGLVVLFAGVAGVGCEGMSGHHGGKAGHGGGAGVGGRHVRLAGRGEAGSAGGGEAGSTASGVAGSDAGGSGGGVAGAGGPAGQGGGPGQTRVQACGAMLPLSADMHLAPAASGQRYVRCGTIGPERDWKIVLSGDGRRVAALTGAGTVRLYASDDGWRELGQLAAPLGRLDAAAFSPDGAKLATLSAETGEVTLWNAANGALARSFAGPPASTIDSIVSSLAFSAGRQADRDLARHGDRHCVGHAAKLADRDAGQRHAHREPAEPRHGRSGRVAAVRGRADASVRRRALPGRKLADQRAARAARSRQRHPDRAVRDVRPGHHRLRRVARR